MPIEPITLAEFESLRVPKREDRFRLNATAWYGTPDRRIIGVIYAPRPSRPCYTAFSRQDGEYLLTAAGTGATDADAALQSLSVIMSESAEY